MSFWVQKGKSALFLAPMEGVTDGPMRALLTEGYGFTHCVTEFLRISQIALPKRCYERHASELRFQSLTPKGTPVIFQLLGGNAERLALSASRAVEAGAKAIDLNFGCPAPTVNNHDGGAALLKHPERIESIVRAVRTAVPKEVPVSAKLRLGWDSMESIHENAERAIRGGASWITIHGRTKTQGYMPPAYWAPIGEIRRRYPETPVIANGEIWTIEDFRRCQEETRCEHFMLGRGALANPYLASQVARELALPVQERPSFPRKEEWKELLTRFLEVAAPLSDNPNYALRRVKQWMRYVASRRSFPDFDLIKRLEDQAALEAILPKIQFPEE